MQSQSVAQITYQVYNQKYAPPNQSLCFTRTTYFTGDFKDSQKVCTEKDLVNLDMKKHFGWSRSGYSELYQINQLKLPPILGIHCETPVYLSTGSPPKGDISVHVINSIGIDLRDTQPPDYKYFSGIISRLSESYDIVWRCAKDFNLNRVILCQLRGGSNHFPDDYVYDSLIPALTLSLVKNRDILPETIGIMETDYITCSIIENMVSKYGVKFEKAGRVCTILNDSNTLYQNAWDPHSGDFGRCT